jgi:hypothetical protein
MGRSPELKTNLGWSWIREETKEAYASLRKEIEAKGFRLKAVVLDGRQGIPSVFKGIPVQICQFHQLQIVRRKLTLRPKTQAGVELLHLGLNITKYTETSFKLELDIWENRHKDFLEEKTYCSFCKKFHYTHKRVRSARFSLRKNLPFLFTYEKYPELNIPNTTNSLDGYWSRLKNLLGAHRGKSKERIRKITEEILRKQTA